MICSEKILGVGSPIVDFLVHVDDRFLVDIGAEKGGMVLVDSEVCFGRNVNEVSCH